MKRHNLEIIPRYFYMQVNGFKNFSLRKHDRDFEVGDEIKLNEIDNKESLCDYKPTGNSCLVRITSILTDFEGLEDGYCILGTELIYAP